MFLALAVGFLLLPVAFHSPAAIVAALVGVGVVVPIAQLWQRDGMPVHPAYCLLGPHDPVPAELGPMLDRATGRFAELGFRVGGTRLLGYATHSWNPLLQQERSRGAERCFVSADGSTLGVLVMAVVATAGPTSGTPLAVVSTSKAFVTPTADGWIATEDQRTPAFAPRPACERALWVPGVEPLSRLYAIHQRFVRHLDLSSNATVDPAHPFELVDRSYAESCAARLRDGYFRHDDAGRTVALTIKGACYAFWRLSPLTRWIPGSLAARRRARTLRAIGAGAPILHPLGAGGRATRSLERDRGPADSSVGVHE